MMAANEGSGAVVASGWFVGETGEMLDVELVTGSQVRNWEILRTLVWLRYVTTSEIVTVLFASVTVGRRRIRNLRTATLS